MTNNHILKTSCELDNQNGKEAIFFANRQTGYLTDDYQKILADFTEWLTRINYAKDSIKSRKRQVKRFLLWLTWQEILSLEKVRKSDLEAYNHYLHQLTLAHKTIKAHIGALKVLNKFRSNYDLPPVLTTYLVVTKDVEFEKVILTQAEITLLFDACENDLYGQRDQVLLALYYGCGLRYMEGASVEQRDINFEMELLLVRKGKGYKQRYVPMSAGTKEVLKNWIQDYKSLWGIQSNLILCRTDGKMIKGNALNRRLKKLVERAEIDKRVTLHTLRHSIATHLAQNGMELESIGQFLGHATLQTTMRYVHIAEQI